MDPRRKEAQYRALLACQSAARYTKAAAEAHQLARERENRAIEAAYLEGVTLVDIGQVIHRTGPTVLRRIQEARRARRGDHGDT